jgi:hypothetical protein
MVTLYLQAAQVTWSVELTALHAYGMRVLHCMQYTTNAAGGQPSCARCTCSRAPVAAVHNPRELHPATVVLAIDDVGMWASTVVAHCEVVKHHLRHLSGYGALHAVLVAHKATEDCRHLHAKLHTDCQLSEDCIYLRPSLQAATQKPLLKGHYCRAGLPANLARKQLASPAVVPKLQTSHRHSHACHMFTQCWLARPHSLGSTRRCCRGPSWGSTLGTPSGRTCHWSGPRCR